MLRDVIARARAEGRTALSEADSKSLLAELGIRVPRSLRLGRSAGLREEVGTRGNGSVDAAGGDVQMTVQSAA